MPLNWTTSPKLPFPPDKEEARKILETARGVTHKMALEIMNGISKFHRFNFPKRYSWLKFYSDYFLFKYLGLMNLWRNFRVYPECTGCGICAQVCPTASITMQGKNPVWASSCEQCMRCVNTCPHQAIYQTMGGDTKGKHKYLEPGFKPLKEKMAK
jgi:ferredoxin